ncbi:hypothetical protein BH23ACT9_BH23ACT9_39010 [soil metagenome]
MSTDPAPITDHPLGPAAAEVSSGSTRRQAGIRLALLVGVVVALAVVGVGVGPDVDAVRGWTAGGGWLAAVVFVLLYAGLTVVGATFGATVAFSIARATGRDAVQRLASGRVARVDAWLGDRGLLAVITLRLVPLVPFSAANYAAGLTAVRRRHFVVGTAVGIVPATVVYTVLGARAADPTDPLFLGAMAALVLLAVLGGKLVRRNDRSDSPTTLEGDLDGHAAAPIRLRGGS